jgi:hypothetical protein
MTEKKRMKLLYPSSSALRKSGVGVFFSRQDAGLLPAKPDSGNTLTIYHRWFKNITQTISDFVFCLFRRQ